MANKPCVRDAVLQILKEAGPMPEKELHKMVDKWLGRKSAGNNFRKLVAKYLASGYLSKGVTTVRIDTEVLKLNTIGKPPKR